MTTSRPPKIPPERSWPMAEIPRIFPLAGCCVMAPRSIAPCSPTYSRRSAPRGGSPDSQHFNVPDLRGRFLRGLGGLDPECATRQSPATGGVAVGCSVGTVQADAISSHTHVVVVPAPGSGAPATLESTLATSNSNGGTVPYTSQPGGGTESRPKNAAVGFIIKI